jgi:predicted CXXCH cytochrome family protein
MLFRYRNTLLVFSIMLMFLFVYAVACRTDEMQSDLTSLSNSPFLNHNDSVHYLGIDQCYPCHSDKFESFKNTGMGSSFGPANPHFSKIFHSKPTLVYDTINDLYYLPEWLDSQFYITEFRIFERDTVHKRTEKIDYIIGSGHHTNSHFNVRNNYVYQAPLTFYTQKGIWDLPPGFEKGNNSRFNRIIEPECMTCHNALPQFTIGSANHYDKIPHGIDCERCHGPGSIHVQRRLKGFVTPTGQIDSSIVNPGKLSWSLQVDVCQRCHLQGNSVLKEGKSFFDFKPGMPLHEVFEVFMPEYADGSEFRMAAHAERFQMSECFKQSNSQDESKLNFTCISCHNPHVSVRETNLKVFNDVCMQCHSEKSHKICTASGSELKKADNQCVTCHMPVSGSEDIPHVTVHDHYIRKPVSDGIQKLKGELLGLTSVNGRNTDTQTLIKAYLTYFEKYETHPLYMERAKNLLSDTKLENQLQLKIHYHYNLQEFEAAAKFALQLNPKEIYEAWTCFRAGRSLWQTGKTKEAENWIKKAVESEPLNLNFRTAYADLLIERKNYPKAEREINFVLEQDPKFEKIMESKLRYFLALGDLKEANKTAFNCLKLNPDSKPALKTLIEIAEQTKSNPSELKYWKAQLLKLTQ